MAILLLLALLALASPLADAARTKASDRVPYYSRTSVPTGWARLSPSSPSTPLTFTLVLHTRNADVLEERFWRVSDPDDALYGRFMTAQQIEALVAPTPSDLAALLSTLAQHGISQRAVVSHGDSLTVRCTVADAASLFATTFYDFEHSASGLRVSRQWGPSSLPSVLSSQLVLALGVQTFPLTEERRLQREARARLQSARASAAALQQQRRAIWTPAAVTALYGVPYPTTPLSSAYVTAGVIEWERESFSPTDLANFSASTSTPLPPVDSHHIVGNNSIARPGGEASLDIQWIEAMAPGATPWFWLVDNQESWMYDFTVEFLAAKEFPKIISLSYGLAEMIQCSAFGNRSDCRGVDYATYIHLCDTQVRRAHAPRTPHSRIRPSALSPRPHPTHSPFACLPPPSSPLPFSLISS